ncbi:Oxoglutarate/iron-dependent oxygenase degradation domain protein [Cordyceps fumosorosea ARSEF 2679]|uniref:uS12 prolyl 3,4-dihydroxylase n=1 Tax=Cordyceps fumosorosea (strain ARSEF 2679) TaxID=1081104 RepID=A0A168DBK4_CORFA|nr:Oxoglutarate/iron-dependent oxygenase degradation domain protein [Cordyceps fumosorosea ARSEF 2679]OAA72405.1 Oxoglutarate/iron-dependent oxygenase degradation domain protein [Cordyceps fumosorosea ARSEF 2679]
MKRKANGSAGGKAASSKRVKASLSAEEAQKRFREGLFDKKVLDAYKSEYAESSPYKHAVIHELVNDKLLRSVRDEVRSNVQFTPKETDIYKIHQSGDLANLDGLDDQSLAKLPSLLALRDAIYSEAFRGYVADITGCGPLSGRKTDMAINVYTPGCYLLCHDDVIGSRRVSYILYLTDPDQPWQPEWGGALRLFPVLEKEGADGAVAKTPLPDVVRSIPPAWNQLSFFAVQPGESFHDVEEVYHAATREQQEKEGGRVRMAISGWFHIPQPGEDGFVQGEEEKNAKNSSLMQLQGNPAQYDAPQALVVPVTKADEFKAAGDDDEDEDEFDEADLTFLLQYISPTYLTPDTLEQVSEFFLERSIITLDNFLSKKFAERVRKYVEAQEANGLPAESGAIEETTPWKVARPPHKHRYLYQHPSLPDEPRADEESPIAELLDCVFPSRAFRNWLAVAAHGRILSHDILARRFRRGHDYTLATNHDGAARLEMNLSITPSAGWGEDAAGDKENGTEEEAEAVKPTDKGKGKAKAATNSKGKAKAAEAEEEEEEETEDVGGQEVYMADDDDDEEEDAAVYKASNDEDNILFHQNAAWNKLTLVMRDSGTLKFTKYVSRKAQGDRWDIWGLFDIEDQGGDDDDEDEEGAAAGPSTGEAAALGESDMEETFNGFSDAGDDDESD